VAETGSTNSDMLNLVRGGDVSEGDWLIAERQTAGRGRLGRNWKSQSGNLFASTVVRLRESDPLAHTLSIVAGWAIFGAVGHWVGGTLKWPNDLMIDNKKLAGILLEREGESIVIGFGVNVAYAPDIEGRDTACIADWHDAVSADDVAVELIAEFARSLQLWRLNGFDHIRKLWESEGPMLFDKLRVNLGNGMSVEGYYSGLDEDGGLRLQLASGKIEVIRAGDVELLGGH
jgi:BirA family transcriptional regulator, biotin operon repressor / biotin---[acetyl-CoA-carboxylase] ligase